MNLETAGTDIILTCNVETLHDLAEDYGYNIASWQELPRAGEKLSWDKGAVDSLEEAELEFMNRCAEAEENARCFSPAEVWISTLNKRDDQEEAWEVVEVALGDGFARNWKERSQKFYTPEDWTEV